MHLVLINQYYPPDAAPTGRMLERVAAALAARGHQVTVLCSKGGYVDEPGGEAGGLRNIRVIRVGTTRFGRKTLAGKLLDYTSFYAAVCGRLLTLAPRPHRIVALTTPPLLSLPTRLFSKFRGADHAHWVMDLYPDAMTAHGMIREGSPVHRALGRLARFGFGGRRLAAVLTLGPDMAERVQGWLPAGKKASWIPLWGTAEERENPDSGDQERAVRDYREKRGWNSGDLILLYSGNMGLGHRFVEFLEAARSSAGKRVRFVFTGGGRRRGEVENFLRICPEVALELHDYVPQRDLALHLLSGDVHLASLEPAWDGTMVPSKLQGSFFVGRPVIFVGSSTCSIGRWIMESGGGWVVAPGDQTGLAAAVQAAGDPDERARRGAAAKKFAAEHFCAQINSAAAAEVLSR